MEMMLLKDHFDKFPVGCILTYYGDNTPVQWRVIHNDNVFITVVPEPNNKWRNKHNFFGRDRIDHLFTKEWVFEYKASNFQSLYNKLNS